MIKGLNLLTPAVVKEASREISTGEHVQLDWSLDNVQFGGFGRLEFRQDVKDLQPALNIHAFDDEIHFNTQIGSQWDSLKHVSTKQSALSLEHLVKPPAVRSPENWHVLQWSSA